MDLHLSLCQAAPTGQEPTPSAYILINVDLPEYDRADWATASAAFYEGQADQLERVLYATLPGGTYDRLFGRMAARLASHYRVSHLDARQEVKA